MTVNEPTSDASHAHPSGELLVSADWLASRIEDADPVADLVIVDVRTAQEYAEGHLPGAINLELSRWTYVRNQVQGILLEPPAFAQLVGEAGISNEETVVIYDANWGMPAARVLWSFRRYGHARVHVLNGGWDHWIAENRPTSVDTATRKPVPYHPKPDTDESHAQGAELEWIQSQIGRDDLVIIDTRSPAEYENGHLPNAINWDWLNAVPVGEWDVVRPAEELREELAALGITPDREIVTYCRSGARAAHTYLVLRHLGFNRVRNYDGSWLEWSLRVLGKPSH